MPAIYSRIKSKIGCSPGSSAQLDVITQGVTINGAPFPPQIFKAVVSTSAVRKVSEGRRRDKPRFSCLFPGCGYASTRRENLIGEQFPFRQYTMIVYSSDALTQTISTRTWALGRMHVGWLGVEHGLRGSTTACGMKRSASIVDPSFNSRPGKIWRGECLLHYTDNVS